MVLLVQRLHYTPAICLSRIASPAASFNACATTRWICADDCVRIATACEWRGAGEEKGKSKREGKEREKGEKMERQREEERQRKGKGRKANERDRIASKCRRSVANQSSLSHATLPCCILPTYLVNFLQRDPARRVQCRDAAQGRHTTQRHHTARTGHLFAGGVHKISRR